MSKHLRFGKLLGMLAVMLTLSFAWGQAQNQSSLKQFVQFGFTTAANPTAQLGTDRWGVINTTTREVTVTVPFETNLTGLIASYTTNEPRLTNVFQGTSPFAPAVRATSGVSPALTWVANTPMTWTVEAENHSYENYFIKVVKAPASSEKSIGVFSANYRKVTYCPAGNVIFAGTDVAFSGTNGTNITFKVNYGAVLDDITVYLQVSPFATVAPAVAAGGTAFDFDTNNDMVPDPLSFVVTAQDGTTRTYVVTPVISTTASIEDYLIATGSMTVPSMGVANANSVVSDPVTQIITIEVPYSATTIAPTWKVSDWARTYTTNPQMGPAQEICSGNVITLTPDKMDTETYNFWIQAEDPSEVSQWILRVKNAAPVTVNTLDAIAVSYIKTLCGITVGPVTVSGTVGSSTLTFAVPYGVTSVKVTTFGKTSSLSTSTTGVNSVLMNGDLVTVVAESGAVKTYTVVISASTVLANGKAMTKFGFKQVMNDNEWAFPDWTKDYWGVLNVTDAPSKKTYTVTVAWNTDLHDLIAYFEVSPYACVSIAESNGTFTPQTPDVTVNDHSNSLTYVVKAEDGTEERYEIIVIKELPLTGNDLIGFKLTGLPYCYGGTFEQAGTFNGTNITVPVKYGTSLSYLAYSFTLSPGATVTGPASPANFSSPVTFVVSSQGGITKSYTVTVVPAAENKNMKLLTYWFAGSDNAILGGDAVGVVNEAAKTVLVKIPWGARNNINDLRARFTLSPGAQMTHSEDGPVLQVSGVTSNDFTTPVAYTVWAETCGHTVEYFVTVELLPNTNTGISAFNFTFTPCATGCPLVNRIDSYARRIYITLPHSMNISNLAPSLVTAGPGAVVTVANTNPAKPWNTAQDWTKGPVTYTVTAPDATANWTVLVENPACSEKDVLAFALDQQVTTTDIISGHGVPVVIDKATGHIDVIIKKGTNKKLTITTLDLSCYATENAPTVLDFNASPCVTFTVTAEDGSTKEWTVCVTEIDTAIPVVTTWSILADNCAGDGKVDSVAVQSSELGRVFLVHESSINMAAVPLAIPLYNLADWTGTGSTSVAGMVAAHKGNWAAVVAVDTPVYVKTSGLYSGTYWAFAVDMAGNLSCISVLKVYVNICEVTVANLTELRGKSDVWTFNLTGEVFVTYEENHTGGNWKFVQDAGAGILIEDRLNALYTKDANNVMQPIVYGEGAGITGLKGKLVLDAVQMRFVPICCYLPTKSSTGNVVTPVSLTFDEYKAQCYTTRTKYESMLVTITTGMKVTDGYYGRPNWFYDAANIYNESDLEVRTGVGQYEWGFVQTILNSPLIGKPFLTVPAIYTGIRTNVNWGSIYGLITPRKEADIVKVAGVLLSYKPVPVSIDGVRPGECKSTVVSVYNEGVDVANITALYLDDSPAGDEFNLVTPPAVPFGIGSWMKQDVTVNFCPRDLGPSTTNLIVEYGVGKTLVIPINGTTPLTYDMPYLQDFKYAAGPPVLWATGGDFNSYTTYTGWSNPTAASAVGGVVIGYYSNWVTPYGGFVANNRSIYMRPRGGSGTSYYTQPVTILTPGVKITGNDPVVSFVEHAWWALSTSAIHVPGVASDPRTLSISEDGVNWTPIRTQRADAMSYTTADVASYTNPTYDQVTVSLKNYVGKTVFFRFDLGITSGKYVYWIIDQFEVKERVTMPIMSASPGSVDFGGVQVGGTATSAITLKNTGISVLTIKKVELVGGSDFSLTDANAYPFEIKGGEFAFPANTATELVFNVGFTPTDVGVQNAKVLVTYGMYDEMVLEIPLTGKGLSCATAADAVIGENLAPTQGVWYKYTAEKFQITQITSCDPRNVTVPFEYSWDTYLEIYQDCNGTFWSGTAGGVNGVDYNDDMEAACPTNRANSSLQIVMNAGETVYIFWKLAFPGTSHVEDPFYFHINPNYPIDGDVCETAIPLTLPVVNHFGTTVGFADDYNSSPCSPFSNYMDGNDKVYEITLAEEGYLIGNILGAYGSIHVLDVCPKTELEKFHCKAYIGGPNGGQFRKKVPAGTYFVIISTWAPPQTVDYLLNMSWESGSAVDNADLMNSMNVYPNPSNGKFTVSISNAEATDMTLELVNISGQVVYRNEVKAAFSYNEDIDASTFAKGVYYLKVSSEKGVKVEKVVVQ